jgi:D-aminoacyl-tRNA deacylase
MNIALLITTPDFAGLNIQEHLLEQAQASIQAEWEKTSMVFENKPVWKLKTPYNIVYLFTTDTKCIECENYDEKMQKTLTKASTPADQAQIDLLIFPTTHRSEKAVQSMCVHAPGNFGEAKLSGIPGKLCKTHPQIMRFLWEQLKQVFGKNSPNGSTPEGFATDGCEVVMEATHHGPDLEVPAIFLEIGSNEAAWKNKLFGSNMAHVLLALVNTDIKQLEKKYVPALGIGGPHYAPNFLKVMEKTNYAFGHICAKYNLENFDDKMLRQALEKNGASGVTTIFVDWKGVGGYKEKIKMICEQCGVQFKRTDKVA